MLLRRLLLKNSAFFISCFILIIEALYLEAEFKKIIMMMMNIGMREGSAWVRYCGCAAKFPVWKSTNSADYPWSTTSILKQKMRG